MKTELYSIIKAPYLTEKVSSLMGESNQYAFKVDITATKLQEKAVEGYFRLMLRTNIIKVKGKTKRSRYRIKKRSDWKKAYVKLAEGQTIEVSQNNGYSNQEIKTNL